MIEPNQVHSMDDFLSNHELHVARLKEARVPEVLTIDGRPEVVMMDFESYEYLVDRLRLLESESLYRVDIAHIQKAAPRREDETEEPRTIIFGSTGRRQEGGTDAEVDHRERLCEDTKMSSAYSFCRPSGT